jgi:methionyl-tRNA synthetase
VWLDAPIGYLAALQNYFDTGKARARGETRTFAEFLAAPDTEQLHFIGKDIIYFHTLFWPAMLKFAGPPYKVPDHVYAHGFITVSGEKMSKSRGTGISPLRYLEIGMNPEWLRYYIGAKLNSNVEDLDFNPEDFVARVNSDLIGKYVNIASRAASFITKHFGGELEYADDAAAVARQARDIAREVAEHYETRDVGKAMREIMTLADRINHDFDARQPWVLAKDSARRAELQDACSRALQGFKLLSVLISPVLPQLTTRVARELFGLDRPFVWSDAEVRPTRINQYHHLMTRVDPKQLDALFDMDEKPVPGAAPPAAAASSAAAAARPATPRGSAAAVPLRAAPSDTATLAAAAAVEGNLISIDDFLRIDLRVAKVLNADLVAGADKLLKLRVDVGELGEREIFAGIRAAYDHASLVGRLIVVVANLEPRKMRFGTSEGMMLAAGPGGKDIFVLSPDTGATPGMRVK